MQRLLSSRLIMTCTSHLCETPAAGEDGGALSAEHREAAMKGVRDCVHPAFRELLNFLRSE